MATREQQREDLANLKALLCQRIDDLVAVLLPDGWRGGKYWLANVGGSGPAHNFWVNLRGQVGTWHHASSGEKGDVIKLIMLTQGLDFVAALKFARAWLGMTETDTAAVARARAKVAEMQRHPAEHEARLLAHNRRRAFAQWLQASERLVATPVETYLRARGIDIARLAKPPKALRFMARKHRETGRWLPTMMALITGPDEAPWSVHRTFLAEDGSGKADVVPARKMWPSYAGGAIRLARGETGMTPGEAAKQGLLDTLCLCEGVEDGLSLALACPELRVWAVCALGNLGHIRLPECCAEVIVAADNDWGKPQAQKLLDAGVAALRAQGRPVRIARSAIGKDANDALVSGGLRMPTSASGRVDTATAERGA